MEDEIKQCPFCASTQTRLETWTVGSQVLSTSMHRESAVMCLNCGAFGPNDLGESGAIEAWNMRRETFPEAKSGG